MADLINGFSMFAKVVWAYHQNRRKYSAELILKEIEELRLHCTIMWHNLEQEVRDEFQSTAAGYNTGEIEEPTDTYAYYIKRCLAENQPFYPVEEILLENQQFHWRCSDKWEKFSKNTKKRIRSKKKKDEAYYAALDVQYMQQVQRGQPRTVAQAQCSPHVTETQGESVTSGSSYSQNSTIQTLPHEILLKIFKYLNLSHNDLLKISMVSKRFYVTATDSSLWRDFDLSGRSLAEKIEMLQLSRFQVLRSLTLLSTTTDFGKKDNEILEVWSKRRA